MAGGLILAIFLIRILYANRHMFSGGSSPNAQVAQGWFSARGKVAGHIGPGERSFKGRAGRKEWWIATLLNGFIGAVVSALIPTIGVLLSLPWMIAGWAATARRLHDLKRSAWLQLAPMALMGAALGLVGVCAALGWVQADADIIMMLDTPLKIALAAVTGLAGLVYLAFYVWLGFFPGSKGSNYYGEADPA